MKLELVDTKESKGINYSNTAYHKIVNTYAIGDYEVCDINRTYENGIKSNSILISSNGANKYTPEIYVLYKEDSLTKIKEFRIGTTSYGSLSLGEYKKFLKAQIDAMKVIEILKEKYCGNT